MKIAWGRRIIAAAAIGLIAASTLTGIALGEDVDDITVSEGQTVKKDYPPLFGVQSPIAFGGPETRNPNNCRASTTHWCDTADLTIEVPSSYTSSDFFKVEIELSWSPPPSGNNVDLFVYRKTGQQVLSSATGNNPEKVSLQDPPERNYFIVVANIQGTNSGYTLTVRFVPQGRIPPPEEPEEFGGPRSQPSRFDADEGSDASFSDLPPPPQPEGLVASVGPRPVERPGPDGATSRRGLVVLAASSPPGGTSRLPFIVSSVAAALVVAGLGVFLYLRGRQDPEF